MCWDSFETPTYSRFDLRVGKTSSGYSIFISLAGNDEYIKLEKSWFGTKFESKFPCRISAEEQLGAIKSYLKNEYLNFS